MSVWYAHAEEKRALRMKAFLREQGHCFWCDMPVTFKKATLDHIIPASRGGKLEIGNVVLSCEPCNNERGDTPAPDYLWKSVSRMPSKAPDTHKVNG